ncbi:putative ribonuclease H-like domain-containing protein [Tanacetum coccineum]
MGQCKTKRLKSPNKKVLQHKTSFRPKDLKQDVKTSGVKNMITAGTRAVVNIGKGKMDIDLKKSRWVWRPKGNFMDHESKEKGSFILKRFEYGNPESILQDHVVVDSGCSSHMTRNKAYLLNNKDYNGGFVAFGSDPKGGKIKGKGKIRTTNLDFDDVYFVDELKFNLFSISQMCDKKNSVLFTDTECLIMSPSFKLLDESQVVLRAPRQNRVYSLDLKNIVPSGGITCLYANATTDESKLWHKRLGHVNFKNINKLVKGHLVRGLPSKVFVNDHTCVACKKGKQHKASCKAKLERTIRKPLELLHMDLFGPVSVESINKKKYCLVVSDAFTADFRSGPDWMFDLDFLTNTMDYIPVSVENQVNVDAEIAAKAIYGATRQAFEEEKKKAAQTTSINKLNTGRPSVSTSNSPLVSTANTPYASAASTPTGANTSGSSILFILEDKYLLGGTIVHQPPGFVDPAHPNKVYKVIKALYGLHQAPRACQDKYVANILKKFDFCSIKKATTPVASNKPLVKDEDGVDVDVHIYRSLIGSLMYLTASRPDIMFAVCACARFQVTPKASHLNAVKRIFRTTYGSELVSAASLVNTVRPTLTIVRLSLCCSKVLHDGNDVWIGQIWCCQANLVLSGIFGVVKQIWCCQANLVLPGKFGAARQKFVLFVTVTTVSEHNRFSLIKYNR